MKKTKTKKKTKAKAKVNNKSKKLKGALAKRLKGGIINVGFLGFGAQPPYGGMPSPANTNRPPLTVVSSPKPSSPSGGFGSNRSRSGFGKTVVGSR